MTIDQNVWWVAGFLFVLEIVVNVVITNRLNKKLKERDEKQEQIEKARLEYELTVLDVVNASAKLSYALAMAIKRGSPNGEVEAGIDAYNSAMQKEEKFLKEQALYRIAK